MASNRYKTPKILWGTSLANTLSIGYPLDNVTTGDTPRDGSSWAQTPSGVEDAWIVGTDYHLVGDVRWIPQTDTTTPLATGWDGTTGFRAFLAWARAKNAIRFYPDAASGTYIDSYLVEPLQGEPQWEPDGTRKIRVRIRNTTTAYDGY